MAKDETRFFRATGSPRKTPPDAERLRQWGERIGNRLAAGKRPNRYEGMIFRPTVKEADALIRLEGQLPFAASEIRAALEETEKRFAAFLDFPDSNVFYVDCRYPAIEAESSRL